MMHPTSDERYLVYGLNALSRAHETNYFVDGHRGAAMISGYYFSRETDLENGVAEILSAAIDRHWAHTKLCAPFPPEKRLSSGIQRVIETLGNHIQGLRQAGHNVIFASLALKAFRQLPDAVTASRVEGICRLIESFQVTEVPLAPDRDIPALDHRAQSAAFILGEWLNSVQAFRGRGQGWSGHLLTYGRALFDLYESGYADLAQQARAGFRLYIRRIRAGPQQTDKPRAEHPPSAYRPHQRAYWERETQNWTLGHEIKYPYGFYGLVQRARDPDLERRCTSVAHAIF